MTQLTEQPSGHVLRVTVEWESVELKVECREPVGAACRHWCTKPGCDWEEGTPHVDGDGTKHPEGDTGQCLQQEWLTNVGVPDCHKGAGEPISDGMLIAIEWDGSDYVWRGVKAEARSERAA